MMVCGVSVLIAVLEKTGGMDLFTSLLARLASPSSINGVIAFVTGAISTYSSTSGVVLPAFLPTIPSLVDRLGGGDPLAIALSINVGSSLVDVSPLSTIGALAVAAVAGPGAIARALPAADDLGPVDDDRRSDHLSALRRRAGALVEALAGMMTANQMTQNYANHVHRPTMTIVGYLFLLTGARRLRVPLARDRRTLDLRPRSRRDRHVAGDAPGHQPDLHHAAPGPDHQARDADACGRAAVAGPGRGCLGA